MIPDLNDPRIPLIVTIERVRISADLQHAKVFVSTLKRNNEAQSSIADTVAALEHAKGYLQRRMANELDMRRTPTLTFYEATDLPF
jgi:ribosome-binding factor A